MRSERLRQRFQDILDNIIRIESFAAGHNVASFRKIFPKLRAAVEQALAAPD